MEEYLHRASTPNSGKEGRKKDRMENNFFFLIFQKEEMKKNIFIIFYQGEQLRLKIKKICDG